MSFKELLLVALMRMKRLLPEQRDDIKTVALVSNTAIGDTLMATPAFRALKKSMPGVKCIAVLNPVNAELFATNPYIDEILLYGGRWSGFLGTLLRLKALRVDAVLLLHSNEPQATPLAVFCGAQKVIKIPNDKNRFAAFHTNPKIASSKDRHGLFDRLEQLKFLGIESNDARMELFLKKEWVAEADVLLRQNSFLDRTLIGFQIGASTLSRMWFEDRWIELASILLASNSNIRILLTGSPKEREAAQKIKDKIADDRVLNIAGALSIGAAAALIGKLNVFVTPDTGPMHIAVALKTPSVALYVVADPVKSGAIYDNDIHVEIKKPRTCDPCVSKLCKYQECMLQIEACEVAKATLKLLK
jgi:ADP-heptose:LPS heptosyltransferase